MPEPLLDPAFLQRLQSLQLATRRRLSGLFAGEHRSPRHGTSVDFSDYRDYHPGDDFRRIDYSLYARLDVLAIKLFEAEEDVNLRLLIDTSASMGMHSKLDVAVRVGAALGFVALCGRDPVTVHTFPLDIPGPRFLGRSAASALFDHLGNLKASGKTPFAAAATRLLSRPGPPGLTVLFSDLLTPDWDTGLRRLPSRGGDLVVVHVLAKKDIAPTELGDVDLHDLEDDSHVEVSLTTDTLRKYSQTVEAWRADIAARCRSAGAAYVPLDPDDNVETLLLDSWREAGVLR